MSINFEAGRIDLINKIDKKIDEKLAPAEATLVKAFLEQYYLGVSSYDLRTKSILDLYGALISHWHFIYKRLPGEARLRVYNPQVEQHGWQSSHTVVEVSHENKPFLLDSLRLALNKMDISIHLVIHAEGVKFVRDATGIIQQVLPIDSPIKAVEEAPIYIEIDKQTDAAELQKITMSLNKVLEDVDIIVKDWPAMINSLNKTITLLQDPKSAEEKMFLQWLADDHFTFIGYAEYNYKNATANSGILEYVPGSGLGVLSDKRKQNLSRDLAAMYPTARDMYLNNQVLLVGKTDSQATVHRPAYTDFVGVKIIGIDGKPTKLIRFIGLYTSSAYNQKPDEIPFIRQKIERVFSMAKFPKSSHDGKALFHIITTLPRDEIYQATDAQLFEFAIGVLHLQERQRIKIFMRRDTYGRYFSCLVFVPRELFTSQLRKEMQSILLSALGGVSVTFDSNFSESVLARIHYMVRVEPLKIINYDVNKIEEQLVEAARNWSDDLKDALADHCGEEKGNELFKMFGSAFPLSYREIFSPPNAVIDIEHIVNLKKYDDSHLEMSLYRPIEDDETSFRFKLFRNNHAIPLSEIVPILERMGLKIISERPHEIKLANNTIVWINDYCMITPNKQKLDTEAIKDKFQDAFDAVWHGFAENDGFNRLVLNASIGWRDISILRAYYRYSWQIGLVFSQSSVEDALSNNITITKQLMQYFYLKFDPAQQSKDQTAKYTAIKKAIELALESVASLNEDRIIRNYLGLINATVRTNFFQQDAQGKYKSYCSYKFDSAKVPDMPLPKPVCEIFVYAPQVEGIHLRGDRVARGGLRWSDRHEDFRTEVLGLMKAQQVKNAVIVPLGAKGGFIVKADAQSLSRDEKMKLGIKCYQTLVRGLLDLTDNYEGLNIIKPKNTVCLDLDDPYLVVAADKGTATFSDIANAISAEYNFWLGDAFASGGSMGYDHKKMAITARGAWESVKMHFQRLNVDLNTQSITVIGIGDMAGDVFGNGMLLSNKIKLIAAFNHLHIFFDPNPNPEASFVERKRLFELPGSGWNDYNAKLISPGGGVFERSAKKITLSPQMQQVLGVTQDSMLPNELIKTILMAQVDLFYNGGIGTFVKATTERNADVGDRANDAIRIDATQLRVRVVCEGGNLGFTQLARIEYAKNGGIINTDAIDNSAGVNCSDNEVNIKILLNSVVAGGDMTEKQRNELLVSMQSQVASLVLANNIKQNEALTLTDYQAASNLQMHNRLLQELQRTAGLDPVVEFLPNTEEIAARIAMEQGFTRPELAVLMAYTKIQLKRQLLVSQVPDDVYFESRLLSYFPKQLQDKKFRTYMLQHRLKRAIIATQISNAVIDEMGINFIQRLEEESGAIGPEIASAYMVAREVFDADNLRLQIRTLGCNVPMEIQIDMLQNLNRLIRRATRWFLRNSHGKVDIAVKIQQFKLPILELQNNIDKYLLDARLDKMSAERIKLLDAGVPDNLAKTVSRFNAMFAALDIVQATLDNKLKLLQVTQVFFLVGGRLNLGWFGEMINKQPVKNHWEALARAAFRDDVDREQRNLAISILKEYKDNKQDLAEFVANWFTQRQDLLVRWDFFVAELKNTTPEFTMFAVALRELLDLSQDIIITV